MSKSVLWASIKAEKKELKLSNQKIYIMQEFIK